MIACVACEKGNGGKHNRNCTVDQRFSNKILGAPDGCWLWLGSLNNRGYGEFQTWRGKVYAHRFAYEKAYGPIPEGRVVMHTCDTPACVRPEHLRLGTQADNIADMDAKGRRHKPVVATHCSKGHRYSPENTYMNRGGRVCRECNNAKRRKGIRKPYTPGRAQ